MPKELKLEDIKRVSDRFIQNCVTLREQRMISQYELSDITGISQQNISQFENGKRMFTLPNLIKYLLGLGIDINKLFK